MTTLTQPISEIATQWQIDPSHSNVEFSVRHLMIASVKGRFGEFAGSVNIDADDPTRPSVDVTVDVASIDTRQAQRDAHLRSPDFFDAEKWPKLSFRGNRVAGDTDSEFKLYGDLTIRDVTRPVVLSVTKEGEGSDPWGNFRAAFSATTKIDRREFGLTWNQALETGGVVVGDEIKISIDVELTATKSAE
jgi:polyisoprenoid-binding protein YceI